MSSRQYSYQTGPPPKHSAVHLTSSAFSANANPDEDWTQISDLAERRRIQNRIAQRNYRKKLKKRLEDLERRAGSSSASPPPSFATLKNTTSAKSTQQSSQTRQQKSTQRTTQQQQQQQYNPLHTPPMDSDDLFFTQPLSNSRSGSHTPPLFYSPYPEPSIAENQCFPPYPTYNQTYPMSLPSVPTNYRNEYEYMAPGGGVPLSLPSFNSFDSLAAKREDESMNPFGGVMSFAAMAGLDAGAQGGYEDPSTPPLCHSYEHSGPSAPGSDNGANGFGAYPGTPMTVPGSPNLGLHY